MHFWFKNFFILIAAIFISSEMSFAAPGNLGKSTIFMIPTIGGSTQENVFSSTASSSSKEYSIKVPVKQPDGSYKLVEVTYTETDTTRTINIPGEGSVSVVKDDNGDYNFSITPEEIKESNNVSCQVAKNGNGKCTIEPFLVLAGDKVISADKLVVDYKEGENLVVAGGAATNLKLVSKDSKTEFNRSETSVGDTQIQVKFGAETTPTQTISAGGISLPIPGIGTPVVPYPTASTKNLELSLNTSRLVHTVNNPNNPSESKTKFQVKDGGVASSIVIDNKDHTKLSINASTQGGISYNSDPFSNKNVTVDTTGAVKGSFNFNSDPNNPSGSLNLSIDGRDKNGGVSQVTIVDNRKDKEKVTINSYGETFVNVAGSKNDPVNFEVGSDYLAYKKEGNGKVETAEVAGLRAKGTDSSYSVEALSANYNKSKLSVQTGSLQYAMTEDDQAKRHAALLGHAYYNSGDINAKLNGATSASYVEYKDPKTAETFNGRAIKSDLVLIGSNMEFSQDGTNLNLNGGVVARQMEFSDKGQIYAFTGNNGSVNNKDYNVSLDKNFNILYEVDTKGDPKAVQFSSGTLSGDSLNNQFKMFNSTTTANFFGTSADGKKIFTVNHTSDGIKYTDGTSKLVTTKSEVNYLDTGLVKYGTAKFDDLTFSQSNVKGKLDITVAEIAVYSDKTDPTKAIQQGEMSLSKLGVQQLDYSVSVTAKDANGVAGNYKIFIFQEGQNKQFKIFGEDGRQVFLDGVDKNNTHAQILLSSLEYFESDKFKSVLGKNIAGNLKQVDPKGDELISFNLGRVEGIQSLNPDFQQFKFEDGVVSQVTPKQNIEAKFSSGSVLVTDQNGQKVTTGNLGSGVLKASQSGANANLDFSSVDFVQVKGQGQAVSAKGINGVVNDKSGTVSVGGLNIEGTQADKVLYGKASLSNLSYKGSNNDKVTIKGAEVVYYSDSSVKEAQADISKLTAESKEYVVDVVAKGLDGKEGKFKVYLYEDGNVKNYKIFAEDGKQVQLDAALKDNQHAKVLVESIEYLQSGNFQSALVKNVSGNLKTTDANGTFALGQLSYVGDKDLKVGSIQNAQINAQTKDINGQVNASQVNFTQLNTLSTKQLQGEITQGVVKVVKGNQDAKISVGSLLATQITNPNQEPVTIVSGKDIDLVAVDYAELVNVSGKLGGINYYKDAKIQRIEMSDLKNLSYEDLNNKINATINSNGLLLVESRDEKGNKIGTYVLLNSSTLEARDSKNGINANLRVGVLELLNDKLNDQNVILKADVEGKVTLDKTKSPVKAEVNFAMKGQNLTTQSQSYVSADGNTVGKYFSISAANPEGRLDKLELSAGPSFLKDAISIQAKGSPEGGKSLEFTFLQDKAKGTYYLRAEFKDGDKVKVKLLPFTLESKLQNGDALAELMITPKGQNFYNHMEIISSIVSPQELTSWLGVADGGMLIARTGTLGGFGFEMMYQNKDKFIPPNQNNFDPMKNKTNSYGAAVYHENDKGDRTSVGVLLSGDSEFDYQTNGRGVLKIMGQDMAQSGRLPGTLNVYAKKDFADGDSFYGGVFVDTTSFTVDPSKLAPNAAYFDGGRNAGKFGASAAYSKKIDDVSRLTVAAGANNNFQDPAFCVEYSRSLGGANSSPVALSKDVLDIVNRVQLGHVPGSTAALGNTLSVLESDVAELKMKYEDTVVVETLRNALRDARDAAGENKVTAESLKKISEITDKDIEVLQKLEKRNFLSGELSTKITALREAVKTKSPAQVVAQSGSMSEKSLRETMDRLSSEFISTTSFQAYEEYTKKLAIYNKLKNQ